MKSVSNITKRFKNVLKDLEDTRKSHTKQANSNETKAAKLRVQAASDRREAERADKIANNIRKLLDE